MELWKLLKTDSSCQIDAFLEKQVVALSTCRFRRNKCSLDILIKLLPSLIIKIFDSIGPNGNIIVTQTIWVQKSAASAKWTPFDGYIQWKCK